MPTNKSEKELIDEYISQLSDLEKKAYEIAIEDLQTSFDVVKCIGYKEWYKNNYQNS
tara:strand:+ start:657 stop:827 length:171 start_codon:yes stop_codon:yes gene_type:complete